MTIPAKEIVNVTPNVLNAGGSALDLNGMVLTDNTRVPIGAIRSFSTADAVGRFFGPSSDEKSKADTYFLGYDNSFAKPGAMLFAQYPVNAVSAYVRGASMSGVSLGTLKTFSGTMTIVVDGATHAGAINLAAATSFSSAATIIQTALDTPVSVTGSVDANVVTGAIAPNVCTGSISGTTLTVSAVASGAVLAAGQTIGGSGVVAGTSIIEQLTGTAGSTGTYQVSVSQTVLSTTITASGGGLTVSAVTTGALTLGQTLSGSGVTTNTTITALGTGTGGTGTYAVDLSQTVGSTAITASGGLLTVTAVSTGTLAVGDVISGTGITVGNTITKLKSGTGGTGTYFVSVGDTAGSTTIVVSGAGVVVTYDSVSAAFVITAGSTGDASTITFPTGAIATSLKLTSATGAVLSQGADAAAVEAFMDALALVSQNWASFFTMFDPDGGSGNDIKLEFSAWTNAQNNRYVYICWDTDVSPTTQDPATSSLGYLIAQAEYSGTELVWEPDSTYNLEAFIAGSIASIAFERTNGRTTFAFRKQEGITPSVTETSVATNLIANGYNFYGAYATANQDFRFYNPGSISGPFDWLDSYIDQIWLTNAFQLALMELLVNTPSIPYNSSGAAAIETALQDPIDAGLNFGIFRPGVTLSNAQIAEVNNGAGKNIAGTLQTRGWYLQVTMPSPQVRAERGSPICTFWYVDGQSVQKINLTSIELQ